MGVDAEWVRAEMIMDKDLIEENLVLAMKGIEELWELVKDDAPNTVMRGEMSHLNVILARVNREVFGD